MTGDAPRRPAEIEQVEAIAVYDDPANPWVHVFFDRVRFRDGREGRYNRIVEGTGRPGVVVLPTDGHAIGLVEVFRYPIGARVIELPRGFGEADAPARDAARELLEETGWTAERFSSLGAVHANSGILSGHVELVVAHLRSWDQAPARDGEVSATLVRPAADVFAQAADGRINDALTLSCLLRARLSGVVG